MNDEEQAIYTALQLGVPIEAQHPEHTPSRWHEMHPADQLTEKAVFEVWIKNDWIFRVKTDH